MIAVYGGTFDPIHMGHIKVIQRMLSLPDIQQLRLLPCYQHPDKGYAHSSPVHRLNMLRLIARPPVLIDTSELERQGVSYTIDTIKSIRSDYPIQMPLTLILGQDVYAAINTWRGMNRLAELTHLIVVARQTSLGVPPTLWQPAASFEELLQRPAGHVFLMHNPLADISSHQVRNLIASGQSVRYMIPGAIWNYIRRNRLYGYQEENEYK